MTSEDLGFGKVVNNKGLFEITVDSSLDLSDIEVLVDCLNRLIRLEKIRQSDSIDDELLDFVESEVVGSSTQPVKFTILKTLCYKGNSIPIATLKKVLTSLVKNNRLRSTKLPQPGSPVAYYKK